MDYWPLWDFTGFWGLTANLPVFSKNVGQTDVSFEFYAKNWIDLYFQMNFWLLWNFTGFLTLTANLPVFQKNFVETDVSFETWAKNWIDLYVFSQFGCKEKIEFFFIMSTVPTLSIPFKRKIEFFIWQKRDFLTYYEREFRKCWQSWIANDDFTAKFWPESQSNE